MEALGDKKENLNFWFFFFCNARVIKGGSTSGNGRGRLKQHSNTNDVLLPMVKRARRAGLRSAVNLGSICLKTW